MIHRQRVFCVTPVADIPALAERLIHHVWTACTAFRLRGLVFANDAFSPDSAQEYAVIRDGRQIESITVSWCTEAELTTILRQLLNGGPDADYGPAALRTDHPEGSCGHCA